MIRDCHGYGDALGGTVTGAGTVWLKKFSAALTDMGLGSDLPIINLHMEAGDGPEDEQFARRCPLYDHYLEEISRSGNDRSW